MNKKSVTLLLLVLSCFSIITSARNPAHLRNRLGKTSYPKSITDVANSFGASGVKSFSTPLVTDKAFIFGTGTNGVVALDKQTLDIKWQFKTGQSLIFTSPYTMPPAAAVESSPVKIGAYIFFGASDGNLYMLDEVTGELNWKTTLGAPVLASPAISGNLLVVADFSGNIYGFTIN